jgi:hypothetical protein
LVVVAISRRRIETPSTWQAAFETIRDTLLLVREVDPLSYGRIVRFLGELWIVDVGGQRYSSVAGFGAMRWETLKSGSRISNAACLIQLAAHARVAAKVQTIKGTDLRRLEAVGLKRVRAFLLRSPAMRPYVVNVDDALRKLNGPDANVAREPE